MPEGGKGENMKSEVSNIKRISHATVGRLKGTGGERSEPEVPERGPTVAPPPPPDPEVPAHTNRKQFTKAFKLRVLEETDAADPRCIAAVLRRLGVYSSSLCVWRKQRDLGELDPRSSQKRGPQPKMDETTRRKIASLEKENCQLNRRLKRAEQIIDIQKKISELMGIPLSPLQTGEDD